MKEEINRNSIEYVNGNNSSSSSSSMYLRRSNSSQADLGSRIANDSLTPCMGSDVITTTTTTTTTLI